jgi:hypothetical protein
VKTGKRSVRYWKLIIAGFALAIILVLFFSPLVKKPIAVYANGTETGPHISIQDPQAVSVTYVGQPGAAQTLNSGQAQPLSLARGDFNQDGIADLVAGYAAPDGSGILALHTGNLDAFAPQSYASWQEIGLGHFPSPFLPAATAFPLPVRPDFLAAGNLLGSSCLDLVAGARGDSVLTYLAGDGHGNFGAPQTVPLPGPLSALTAGRFGSGNLPSRVIVGIGGSTPMVLVYSVAEQKVLAQAGLPSAPTSFVLDDMDGDGLPDVVILAGGQVTILHAASASGNPQLESVELSEAAVAVTSGFFVHDRGGRRQMAVLGERGTISIVAHSGFDSRGWTQAEVKAMRDALVHHQPNPFRSAQSGPATDGWKVVETLPASDSSSAGQAPLLLRSRLSAQGTDDILLIDAGTGQIALASHPGLSRGAISFTPARRSTRIYLGGTPVAALSFRVNADAREGLVLLHQGETRPFVIMPVPGHRPADDLSQAQSRLSREPANEPLVGDSKAGTTSVLSTEGE